MANAISFPPHFYIRVGLLRRRRRKGWEGREVFSWKSFGFPLFCCLATFAFEGSRGGEATLLALKRKQKRTRWACLHGWAFFCGGIFRQNASVPGTHIHTATLAQENGIYFGLGLVLGCLSCVILKSASFLFSRFQGRGGSRL